MKKAIVAGVEVMIDTDGVVLGKDLKDPGNWSFLPQGKVLLTTVDVLNMWSPYCYRRPGTHDRAIVFLGGWGHDSMVAAHELGHFFSFQLKEVPGGASDAEVRSMQLLNELNADAWAFSRISRTALEEGLRDIERLVDERYKKTGIMPVIGMARICAMQEWLQSHT